MHYIIFFICATVFSLLINGLFLKFSRTLGTKNNPGGTEIRWGSTTKPAFGGISFYIVFLLSFAVYAIVFASKDIPLDFFGILIASSIGFLIGLADDAYNTKPILKFLGQFACAFVLINFILSPKRPDPEKLSAYECGFEPFEDSRMEFDVRFYLVAILFILSLIHI